MRFAEANTAFFPRVKKKKNDAIRQKFPTYYYITIIIIIVIVRAARFIPTMIQRVSILASFNVLCVRNKFVERQASPTVPSYKNWNPFFVVACQRYSQSDIFKTERQRQPLQPARNARSSRFTHRTRVFLERERPSIFVAGSSQKGTAEISDATRRKVDD